MSRVGKGRENTLRLKQVGSTVGSSVSGPRRGESRELQHVHPMRPRLAMTKTGGWRMVRIQRERPTSRQPLPSLLSRLDHD